MNLWATTLPVRSEPEPEVDDMDMENDFTWLKLIKKILRTM